MNFAENRNAPAGHWGVTTDGGADRRSVAMARRPAPPSRRDRISELLMEVKGLVVDIHEANIDHAKAQLSRTRAAFHKADEVEELWREERAGEFEQTDNVVPLRQVV